jgi:hypothetical protein
MKKYLYLLSTAILLMLSACSKEKQLTKRLEGTWNIDKYEGTYTSGGQTYPDVATNAGSFTFKEGGTGNAVLKIVGSSDETFDFTWSVNEETLTITETGEDPITFEVQTNEKTKQVWYNSTTYPSGDVETLKLSLSKK